MLRVENNNKEVLAILHGKLQRDNEKLFKKIPEKDKTKEPGVIADAFTFDSDRNKKLMMISVAPSAGFIAVGLLQTVIGLVSFIPSLDQPQLNETVRMFTETKKFAESTVQYGATNVTRGFIMLALPVGIAAISISPRIHQELINKRKIKINDNNVIVQLIDDLLEPQEKDDKTIEFASKFIKKVDISGNSLKTNLEIVKYLAFYRGILYQKEQGKLTDEEVEQAYDAMMAFLKSTTTSKETSEDYKHNRYLNILINEYDEKMLVRYILSGGKTK